MRITLIAAALAFGGTAALAQTYEEQAADPAAQPTEMPAPETTTTQPMETPETTTMPPTETAPATTTAPPTPPLAASGAGTGTVAPSNANPETDARGIPVVSDPAVVPAGANVAAPIPAGAVFTPNPNQAQVFTPQPATEDYPSCSRTVTDNCLQTYERARAPE